MSNCETCVYWRKPTQGETWGKYGLGQCSAVPLLYAATDWTDDSIGRVILDDYKNTKAFVQDGENYCGFFLTRPDFGCVDYTLDTQ